MAFGHVVCPLVGGVAFCSGNDSAYCCIFL